MNQIVEIEYQPRMNTIGLIAAMRVEADALLKRFAGAQVCKVGAFRGYRFPLNGQDCLLLECGIGMERAEQAARSLLKENPRLLVSFGVAGAVSADLAIGDVVVARRVCRLEGGTVIPLGPLADLPGEARSKAAQALRARGARLVDGAAVTTRGEQAILSQPEGLENPVLEMETAGIAAAVAQAGVPLLALRGISDNPHEPIPLDLSQVYDSQYRLRWGRLLGMLLRHPRLLGRAGAFRRNTLLAAENTAAAVAAAFGAIAEIAKPEGEITS